MTLSLPNYNLNSINSFFFNYYLRKLDLKTLRRKSLNQFFFNLKNKRDIVIPSCAFALILLSNPNSVHLLRGLAEYFNSLLYDHNLVFINFIPSKLQNLFTVSKNSNIFLITANDNISLFLFLDFLLRLKINFLLENISEVVDSHFFDFYSKNQTLTYYTLQYMQSGFTLPSKKNARLFYTFLSIFTILFVRNFLIFNFLSKNVNVSPNL